MSNITSFSVELAQISDLDELMDLDKLCFIDADNYLPATWHSILHQNDYYRFSWIVRTHKQIIGYILGDPNYDVFDPSRHGETGGEIGGEIVSLCIHPEFRCNGFASLLLDICIENLFMFWEHIELNVRSKNQAAINLYEKKGFEKVGVRTDYYGDDDSMCYTLHDHEDVIPK
jgi:ribosomal protein S18 acetylase RimI-like enzyme